MRLSYIACYLIGLVTMYLSVFADDMLDPYKSLIKLGGFLMGLILVVNIMRIDNKNFEDEE